MTIQPIEVVDLLAGLEEDRRCEHSEHGARDDTHADGGEMFVLIKRPCGCPTKSPVVVFCQRFIEHPAWVHCPYCSTVRRKSEAYTILGPANPTTTR